MTTQHPNPLGWEPAEPQALHEKWGVQLTPGPPPIRRRLSLTGGKPPVRRAAPDWTPIRPRRTVSPRDMHKTPVTEQPVGLDFTPQSAIPTVIETTFEVEMDAPPSSWGDHEQDWFSAEPAPTMDPAPSRQRVMAPVGNAEYALLAAVVVTALTVLTASGAIVAALL